MEEVVLHAPASVMVRNRSRAFWQCSGVWGGMPEKAGYQSAERTSLQTGRLDASGPVAFATNLLYWVAAVVPPFSPLSAAPQRPSLVEMGFATPPRRRGAVADSPLSQLLFLLVFPIEHRPACLPGNPITLYYNSTTGQKASKPKSPWLLSFGVLGGGKESAAIPVWRTGIAARKFRTQRRHGTRAPRPRHSPFIPAVV